MSTESSKLPGKAARGALLTFAGQLSRTVIQLFSVVILARLLVPADFGLVAMVVAIAGFGDVIREFGLGIAAIQASTLTKAQRNNLFWANTLLGLLVGIVFYFLAHPISVLYGDARLVAVVHVISITFLLNGMAAQYRASLQRDLRFGGVVVADVASMLVGVGLAIALAVLGVGYWSIVSQQIAQPVVGLLVVAAASRWLPGGIRRGEGTRSLLTVGWNVFAYQLLMYTSRNVDTVLVGAKFGAIPAGYYNRAFNLMTVPLAQFLTPSTRIAVSVLSKLQDDLETFGRYLVRAQDALNFACLAILSLLFAEASAVVSLLLGPKWDAVVPIFQILAVAGVFQVFAYPPLWALLALGHSRANLLQAVVGRCVLIGAVFAGSFYGVHGVAIGYAFGMAAVWPISLFCLAKVSPLRTNELISSAIRHTTVFSGSASAVSATMVLCRSLHPVIQIFVGMIVMTAFIILVAGVWPAFRRDAVGVYRVFLRIRSKNWT